MTDFRVDRRDFSVEQLKVWVGYDSRYRNWPVVYTLDNEREVYVGETLNAGSRMRQHLESDTKKDLTTVRIVVDDTFNKSACLDLESTLIRYFAGDGKYRVLNRNDGITEAEYYDRPRYQAAFDEIFEKLRADGMFTRSIREIENSDLFKLSPYKALTDEQALAVEKIVEGLLGDRAAETGGTIVVQGDPGTGKTIVAIYLMKLLRDIANAAPDEGADRDTRFADLFTDANRELLAGIRIGLVVPQQSLRKSIQKVFRKTPGLDRTSVLTPFDVGAADDTYDLLIVDETHRLNQRANQASAAQNTRFREINERLFGADATHHTQLDWIRARSRHQIFLIDSAQSVRPADLPTATQKALIAAASERGRFHELTVQMRVTGGAEYVAHVRRMLDGESLEPRSFGDYEFRMFDDLKAMRAELLKREREVGLSRLMAGYAWRWVSKKDPKAYDIELDGVGLRWNRATVDWINSPGSVDEVGSIHTVQGYDLNYGGVIIGPELRYDAGARRIVFDRSQYFDRKGMEANTALGLSYSDDQILEYVKNIYRVLLTRGMRGTYVYVCDPALRSLFGRVLP